MLTPTAAAVKFDLPFTPAQRDCSKTIERTQKGEAHEWVKEQLVGLTQLGERSTRLGRGGIFDFFDARPEGRWKLIGRAGALRLQWFRACFPRISSTRDKPLLRD